MATVKGTKGQEILTRLVKVRKELQGILRELEASEKASEKAKRVSDA